MSDYLLIHLHDAFKKLQESLLEANRVIASGDLPVWLPEPFEQDRKLAADTITECWHQDEKVFPLTGLICVSPEHHKIIETVNDCKKKFKKQIKLFKEASPKKKINLDTLIESEAKTGGRNAEVAEAMQVLRISRLNLLWCYRRILVLPKHLDSVSWTWSTSGKSIKKISYKDAVKLVEEEIANEDTKKLAKDILLVHQSRQLVRVKDVAPHLRANITFDKGGERTRKMVTTPTVIISQDAKLPRFRPPQEYVKTERLDRTDVKLNSEPIFKALGIYTYIDQE